MRKLFTRNTVHEPCLQGGYDFADRPPSAESSLCFQVDISMWWRTMSGTDTYTVLSTLAQQVRDAITTRAAEHSVLRPDAAEHDMVAATRRFLTVFEGIEVVQLQICIHVDAPTRDQALLNERARQHQSREDDLAAARADAQHARQIRRLRHELETQDLTRQQITAHMRFVRDTVLADPATARLYRLLERSGDPALASISASTDAEIDTLVGQIHQWDPNRRWVKIAQILHDFLTGLSLPQRKALLVMLADAAEKFERPDTSGQLRHLAQTDDTKQAAAETDQPNSTATTFTTALDRSQEWAPTAESANPDRT